MINNLFYYSTNTILANMISKQFYSGSHYIWCSPVFDPASLDKLHIWRHIPPSSSPFEIYQSLKKDVSNGDMHSAKIEANKVGLKKGAGIAFANSVIDKVELATITYMIDNANLTDFNPLLYLIPVSLVSSKVEEVPVTEKANPLSFEYRISDLKDNEFEIIHQF